jgi:hypothetical protein
MEAMAPSAAAAPAMVEDMFSTWLSDQTINGFTVPARPAMQDLVLSSWPRVDGALDLAAAPVRLLAIVNRLDLRDLSRGQAGEGRFVFGVTDSAGQATPFTIILEYRLPASSEAEVLEWANLWHGLNGLAPGSAEYNAALEVITERFAGDNADPARVNGSALNQIRTNEIALAFPWELREFTLGGSSFTPATVKLTPDSTFIDQEIVAQFINENEGSTSPTRSRVSPSSPAARSTRSHPGRRPASTTTKRATSSRSTPATAATAARRTPCSSCTSSLVPRVR